MARPRQILFDMDGVITSEEGYWRATACALIDFAAHLGHDGARQQTLGTDADALAWNVILNRPAKAQSQNAGINTNWDHCHLAATVLVGHLCQHDPANADRLARIDWTSDAPIEPLTWPENLGPDLGALTLDGLAAAEDTRGFALLEHLARSLGDIGELFLRRGPVWEWLFRHFQDWFNGTAPGVASSPFPHRKGIIHDETLILPPEKIAATLEALSKAGWELGVATGRLAAELLPTLRRFDILRHFNAAAIVTHDQVAEAEAQLAAVGRVAHLSKPNPFPFLRALFPDEPAARLASPDFLPLDRDLVIVGDTVGDMGAAAKIGARAVGVLTGPAGAAAEPVLRNAGATDILSDMTGLPALLA